MCMIHAVSKVEAAVEMRGVANATHMRTVLQT